MNRRGFLRGLLCLPLAPLAAKLLPEQGIPCVWTDETKVTEAFVGMDMGTGSDHTSIWLVEWSERSIYDMSHVVQLVSPDHPVKINWLKRSIRGN